MSNTSEQLSSNFNPNKTELAHQQIEQQKAKREVLDALNKTISPLANYLTGAYSTNISEDTGTNYAEKGKSMARRVSGWAQRFVTDRFNLDVPGFLSARDVTTVWEDVLDPHSKFSLKIEGNTERGSNISLNKNLKGIEAIISLDGDKRDVLAKTTLKNIIEEIINGKTDKSQTYLRGLTQIAGAQSRFVLLAELESVSKNGYKFENSQLLKRLLGEFVKSFNTVNSQYKVAETAHRVGKLPNLVESLEKSQVAGFEGTGLSNTRGEIRGAYNPVYFKDGKWNFSPAGLLKTVSSIFQRAALNPVTAWMGFAPTLVAGATITQDNEKSITNLVMQAAQAGKSNDEIRQLIIASLEHAVTKQENLYEGDLLDKAKGLGSVLLGYSTMGADVGVDAASYIKALEIMEQAKSATEATMAIAKDQARQENGLNVISDDELASELATFRDRNTFLSFDGAQKAFSNSDRALDLTKKIAFNTASMVAQGRLLNFVGSEVVNISGSALNVGNSIISETTGVNIGHGVEEAGYNLGLADQMIGLRKNFGWTSAETNVTVDIKGKSVDVVAFAAHDAHKFTNALQNSDVYVNGDTVIAVPKGTVLANSDIATIGNSIASTQAVNTNLVPAKDLGQNQVAFVTDHGKQTSLSGEVHVVKGSNGDLLTGKGNSGTFLTDASGQLYSLSSTGDNQITASKWDVANFRKISNIQEYATVAAGINKIFGENQSTSVSTDDLATTYSEKNSQQASSQSSETPQLSRSQRLLAQGRESVASGGGKRFSTLDDSISTPKSEVSHTRRQADTAKVEPVISRKISETPAHTETAPVVKKIHIESSDDGYVETKKPKVSHQHVVPEIKPVKKSVLEQFREEKKRRANAFVAQSNTTEVVKPKIVPIIKKVETVQYEPKTINWGEPLPTQRPSTTVVPTIETFQTNKNTEVVVPTVEQTTPQQVKPIIRPVTPVISNLDRNNATVVPTIETPTPIIKPVDTKAVVVPTVNSYTPSQSSLVDRLKSQTQNQNLTQVKPTEGLKIYNKVESTSGAGIAQEISNGQLNKVAEIAGWQKITNTLETQFEQQRKVPELLQKLASGDRLDQKTLNQKVSGLTLSQWDKIIEKSPKLRNQIINSDITINPSAIEVGASSKVSLDLPGMLLGLVGGKVAISVDSKETFKVNAITNHDIQSHTQSSLDVSSINFKLDQVPQTGTTKVISENGFPIIYKFNDNGIQSATVDINREGKSFAKVIITNPEVLANLTSGKVTGVAAVDEMLKDSKDGVFVQYSSGQNARVNNPEQLLNVLNARVDQDPNYLNNKSVNVLEFNSKVTEIPKIVVNGQNFAEVAGKNMTRLGELRGKNNEFKNNPYLINPEIVNNRTLGLYLQTFQNSDASTQRQLLEGLVAFRQNQLRYGIDKVNNTNNPEIKAWASISHAINQLPENLRSKFNNELRAGKVSEDTTNQIRDSIVNIDNTKPVTEALINQQQREFNYYRNQILRNPIPKDLATRFDHLTPQEQARLVEGVKGDSVLNSRNYTNGKVSATIDNSLSVLTNNANPYVNAKKISGGQDVKIYSGNEKQSVYDNQFAQIDRQSIKNSTTENRLLGINIGGVNGVAASKILFAIENFISPVSFSTGSTKREGSSGVVDLGGNVETSNSVRPETAISYLVSQDGRILQKMHHLMTSGGDDRGYGYSFNETVNAIYQDVQNSSTTVIKEGKTVYRYNIGGNVIDTERPISREEFIQSTRNIAVNFKEIGARVKTATGLSPHEGLQTLVETNVEAYPKDQVLSSVVSHLGEQARTKSQKVVENLFAAAGSITDKKISAAQFHAIEHNSNFRLATNVQDLGFSPDTKLAIVGKFASDGGDYSSTFGKGFYLRPGDIARLRNGEMVRVIFKGCHGNIGFVQLPELELNGRGVTNYNINNTSSNLNIRGNVGSGFSSEKRTHVGLGFQIPHPTVEKPRPPEHPPQQKPKIQFNEGKASTYTAPAGQPQPLTIPKAPPKINVNSGSPSTYAPPSNTAGPVNIPTPKTTVNISPIQSSPMTTPGNISGPVNIPTPKTTVNFSNPGVATSTVPSATPVYATIPTAPIAPVPVEPLKINILGGSGAGEVLPNLPSQ
jgi:hypothetical protein